MSRKVKKYRWYHLLLDIILTCFTGGFWLIVILIRFLRVNSRK